MNWRILVDNKFLDASLEKATFFFIYGILPEYLGSGIPGYPITYRHLQKMKQHLLKKKCADFVTLLSQENDSLKTKEKENNELA